MNGDEIVRVEVLRLEAANWGQLGRAIATATGWTGQTEVWSYLERVAACALTRRSFDEELAVVAPNEAELIEGRFFTTKEDVRWLRGDRASFEAWLTRESGDGVLRCRPREVRYYLIGTYARDRSSDGREVVTCREDRYPRKEFEYPIGGVPDDEDRAYISVTEYAPLPPEPSWPADAAEVERLLNRPRTVAHRFTGVHVGRDVDSQGKGGS